MATVINNLRMRKLSITSFLFFIGAVTLNLLKADILSVSSGYAPNEIKFTYTIIFPLLCISLIISCVVYYKWLSKKGKLIDLFLALPGFLLGGIYLIFTLYLLS